MSELPHELFRRWGHSFEEDAGELRVYRPDEYEFPRARGRGGIEFKPDGTFVDWTIGPGDAPRGVTGRWRVDEAGHVTVSFEGGVRPGRKFEIVESSRDVLKLRETGGST